MMMIRPTSKNIGDKIIIAIDETTRSHILLNTLSHPSNGELLYARHTIGPIRSG
jgi:hypothetical protein